MVILQIQRHNFHTHILKHFFFFSCNFWGVPLKVRKCNYLAEPPQFEYIMRLQEGNFFCSKGKSRIAFQVTCAFFFSLHHLGGETGKLRSKGEERQNESWVTLQIRIFFSLGNFPQAASTAPRWLESCNTQLQKRRRKLKKRQKKLRKWQWVDVDGEGWATQETWSSRDFEV